ncbi:MAG: Ig-like domain-containing protein [Oribacterium sp.]|nr:Ig-like domain-containing protein [Oribacterium sp.]
MKHRTPAKRITSILLGLQMVLLQPLCSLAEIPQQSPTVIAGARLSEDQLTEGELVYFGVSGLTLKEATDSYEIAIYREGNLDQEASVTVHTLDISALYNEDYQLLGDDITELESGKTLLQQAADRGREETDDESEVGDTDDQGSSSGSEDTDVDSDAIASGSEIASKGSEISDSDERAPQGTEYRFDADGNLIGETGKTSPEEVLEWVALATPSEAEDEADADESEDTELASPSELDDEDEAFDEDADLDDEEANASDLDSVASASVLSVAGSDAVSSTKSRLAMLKEAATGEPTREEGSSGVSGSLTDAILSQILPEQVAAIPHSAEQTIYFAPGEDVQYLRFRICDDDRSEGTEAFSVMITSAENMEPYKVTSLSVIITDDEASEQSALSFADDEFTVEDGKALVTLQREGAEYSMASANIRGKDAESGAEQVYGTVVFAPYETEKEVELALTKDSTLYLSDYLAAQAGTTTEANAIVIDGEEGTTLFSSVAMLSDEDEEANASNGAVANGSEDLFFDITIGGKAYKVKYKKGDVVADIYDESYQPALEVGQYFFSASTNVGGIFSYGKDQRHGSKPNGLGTLQNCYLLPKGETDFHKGEGKLEYLHTTTGCTGSVWSSNENPPAGRPTINGLYYQYLIPHWKQISSYGGGNKLRFKLHALGAGKDLEQKDRNGKFVTPELSSGAAIKVQNVADNIEAIVYAVDASKTQTPKSYMRFYGVAAMYKKYEVSVTNPEKMSFLGTTDTVPMQVKMECGAQIIEAGKTDSRNIFTNVDTDDANIVFTLDKSTVNGVDGYFGTITGYTITIPAEDPKNKVTASYPEAYLSYLDSMTGKSVNSDAIDLSKDAVKTVKERATAHLDTIVMDKYFVNWIESLKGQTYAEKGELSSASYYQKLNFKPTVAYTDVKVSVVPPDAGGGSTTAGFTSSDLPKAGASGIFHAGDTLDLSATSEDANYRVTGFEISEDGGVHFNSIRDTRSYTLRSGKNYVIRPLLAKNDNHVEIVFASDEARKNLSIENLIPQDQLGGSYLKGKNVLNLNPEKSGWAEMMKPAIGAACTVRVLVNGTPSDSNYVYRPVITDQMTGRTYQTQGYSFILRSNTADNLLKLDIEKVKKSDLREYSLSGTVVTRVKSIRETALEAKTNPAEGYAVSLANGEFVTNESRHVQLQSSTADDNGIISLAGLRAKEGDRVSLLIDNGIDDAQVADFVFGSGTLDRITQVYSVDAGMLEVQYPITAPVVTSISYDYDKSESRQKTDLRKNQVRCFDDNLKLTAVVDTKGRSIEKLVFTVRTVTGSTADYEGRATLEGSNIFTAEIPSMLTNLHNGDRITVQIVDKEKRSVTVGDTAQSIPIIYPTVDTGLVSYVENEKIAPKSFDIDGAMGDVNIPLLGAAKSTAQSGILNFSRLDYPDKSGYSLNINFDMMLKDGSLKTNQQKTDAVKNYHASAKRAQAAKKEAIAAGEDAANAGESADQIRSRIWEDRELTEQELRDLNDYEVRKAESEALRERKLTEASNERASMTKAQGYIDVRAIFNLSFEFLLDPVQNEYVLATTAVTVGGAVDASKTFYTMVGYVPCFLNLSGGVEVDLTMGGVCAAGKAAFSEGDFNAYSGNVQNIFSGSDFLIELDSVVKAKVQVGAGLCGVLSARGYVSIQMKLQLVKDNVSGDPYGIILNAAGGLGFDLVLLKVNFNIAKIEQGWGNYAGKTKVEFFNNAITKEFEDTLPLNAASADDTDDHAFALNAEGDDEASTAGTFPLRAILDEAAEEDDVAAAFSLNDAYEEAYAGLGGDEISFQRYDMGSADMSSFGEETSLRRSGGVNAQPVPVRMQILLEHAAERTRPEMVELPDGRAFAVFIAASDNGDTSRLYYTISNQAGDSWSVPVALDEDGSYDSMPALTVVGNKVVIAWMDASHKIEGMNDEETMDAYRKKFNAFRINGRVYDAGNGQLGDEFQISGSDLEDLDQFYLQAPSLCTAGDKVYCTYVARDISKLTKLDELTDLRKGYSTAVRATLNLASDPVVEKNEYVVIRDAEKIDPLVTDYQTEGIRIEGTDYLVTAYTLDQDADLTTGDRKLYLGLGDVTNSRNYYPIRIGSDDKCQAVPKLTKVNGHLVLSWTEDGELLELLDVSELIEALFHSAEIGDAYKNAAGAYYVQDGTPDYDWYKKTASELGLPKEVPDKSSTSGYNGSYYEAITQGDFRTVETRIKEDEDHSSSIDDYTITGDGRDLYVFYTDFGPEIEKATVELYGRRYRMAKDTSGSTGSGTSGATGGTSTGMTGGEGSNAGTGTIGGKGGNAGTGTTGGEGSNAGTGTNGSAAGDEETGPDGSKGNGHHSDRAWGFTDAVRITNLDDLIEDSSHPNAGKVIDDFTLTMATDGSIRLLSDFYEQWIDEDGKIQFSQNALAAIDFARGGSLEIDPLSIDMDSSMIAGETSTIRFDVRNAGLLEAKGFSIEAYLMENGVRTLLYKGKVDRLLDTNEETTVQIPWTVPNEDLDGKSILLSVVEKDTAIASETTAEVELKSEARLRLDMGELTFDGKEAIIPLEIENIGNAASSAGEVVAYVLDGAERQRAVGSIGLGALGSGASVEDTLRFTPETEDWDGFGRISLELVAVQDGASVASAYGDLYSAEPVVLEIEDGAESLNLTAKAQQTLQVQCVPWGALCTDLRYRSSDSRVATVDENGTVTAVGNGSCTIEVYSPKLMLKDEITVHVSGAQGGSEGGGGSGSSSRKTAADRASELYASGLPTWVETGGRWIQNADGSWSYQTGTSPMTNRWVCIYNPYADERRRQKRYGWFKFGPDGKMLTGWVTDADGNIYYLNPASDGTRGMMLIGWQQIDGKWYYFSKDEGSGTMGALLRNTITPDGYHVDQTGAWTGR